eukprot:gene1158-1498_t
MQTLKLIRHCVKDGSLLSEASQDLTRIRQARQANKEAARSLVTQIARQLHASGAAEGREPLLLRGRYCVAVKASQRSALSKGSVKLGASGTGATVYVEPRELLELNNNEALLAEQETEAEMQVLADIGDAQSLQQNLSTFSGHIRRLKLLLAAAGPNSLVLLDEVGSGTNPEIKAAADEDKRYINVSMEFNTLTLQPTYKLCWGSAGSSNALDIAQALGFDSRVLAQARILARLATNSSDEAASGSRQMEKEEEAARYRDKYREIRAYWAKLKARFRLVDNEAATFVIQ